MSVKRILVLVVLAAFVLMGCQQTGVKPVVQGSLSGVPAQRLSYSFEPDALPPVDAEQTPTEERHAGVQADFDQNRPGELLDKTIVSPDQQRVLAVYHRATDSTNAFRLDMYSAEGKPLAKISPDAMAVSILDMITWSPDSSTAAFVGVVRQLTVAPTASPAKPADAPIPPDVTGEGTNTDANTDANIAANMDANANADANAAVTPAVPTQTGAPVKLFANEQVYTANKDGGDLKNISQKDTLIYFYMQWSPDSTMLATLACTPSEWQYGKLYASTKGEEFIPFGRPRLIEKIGRERLLDDNLTVVKPTWSPDSTKVACAFDKDVKIYDTTGEIPTYAAIPLRQPLLSSSFQFDQKIREQDIAVGNTDVNANSNAANVKGKTNANANVNVPQAPASSPGVQVMPNEADLVSFNPIVELRWGDERTIYVQTGYIKLMLDSRFTSRSYMRWHKLNLSSQTTTAPQR